MKLRYSPSQRTIVTDTGEIIEGVTHLEMEMDARGVTRARIDLVGLIIGDPDLVNPEELEAAVSGLQGIEEDLAGS